MSNKSDTSSSFSPSLCWQKDQIWATSACNLNIDIQSFSIPLEFPLQPFYFSALSQSLFSQFLMTLTGCHISFYLSLFFSQQLFPCLSRSLSSPLCVLFSFSPKTSVSPSYFLAASRNRQELSLGSLYNQLFLNQGLNDSLTVTF